MIKVEIREVVKGEVREGDNGGVEIKEVVKREVREGDNAHT